MISSQNTGKKGRVVVVVGGGPAGALTAKAMADRGYDVKLMEGYPHPEKVAKNSPKAYLISLRKRGYKSLAKVLFNTIKSDDDEEIADKLQKEIPNTVISDNMVRHVGEGKTKSRNGSTGLLIPRKYLTSGLLALAEKSGADIYYETKLVDINFEERKATFAQSIGNKVDNITVSYDLLIGADGSKSTVRTLLDGSKKVDDFSVVRIEEDSMEYQVVTLPSSYPTNTVFPGLPETSIHTWNDPKFNSICLAFPLTPHSQQEQDNGSMILPVVFPEGKLAEFKQNDSYQEPLKKLFHDLSDEIRNDVIAKQLCVGESSNGGLCVWCTSMGSPKHSVVLLGDSAHGMWPSLGQGANCALETVAVFIDTLDDISDGQEDNNNSPWSRVLIENFNQRRHKDAIAAVDLTYGGIGKREARGRQNSPLSYKFQILIMMLLSVFSGGIIPKPALIRLMGGDDNVSYSKIKSYHFYYERVVSVSIMLVILFSLLSSFANYYL